MRNVLKSLVAVALVVPAVAFGAITGSRHDLSSTNTAVTIRSTNTTQLCVFCHTPHGGQSTQLLWNHTATAQATFSWGVAATTAGTPLPTTGFSALTLRCLSCHDGSIGVGSVLNVPNGTTGGVITITGGGAGGVIPAGLTRVGNGGAMAGHHPVAIPYAGTTALSVTYNGIQNRALVGTFDYYAPLITATCTTPTGACTSAPNTGNTLGANVTLYGNAGAAPTAANVGIECASCHDVHNENANVAFTRVSMTGSGLCLSCHRK